jgi:4-amino-4-deoxy-L-arabinose transferase-like glycosyltransferase
MSVMTSQTRVAAAVAADPAEDALPRWRRGPAVLIAVATVALHLAVATGYGFHRDELYFLAESKRLAWGFVSEQPFVPALGWLSRALFGDSLVGLRLWPALAGAGVVLLATAIARAFGGRTTAQVTAGLCAGTATISLSLFHLFGPTAFDQLAWAGCLLILVRLLSGADPRWWLGFGAVAGVGLWNKNTLVLLAIALVVAIGLTPGRRRWLRSPWPWAGGGLAVLVVAPNLVWQAVHGWSMLGVAGTISDDQGGPVAAWVFLPMQVLTMNPLLAPIWVAGLWWLWRSARFRPLAWMYVVLLVLLAVIGGRSYYLAPMYLPLFAAGGVAAERWLARGTTRFRAAAVPVAVVAAAVLVLPTALPVLPVGVQRDLPITAINPVLADAIGWPELVRDVTAVRDGLPAAEQASAVVLASNYGEAGAVELLGRSAGLGQPAGTHNS